MMKSLLILAFFIGSVSLSRAQAPSADELVKNAYAKANRENKHVIIIFHASWCVWCHKMDSSMNDASCKKFFDDNFVFCYLVVDESKDKKNLENPGANELRAKYYGDNQGIPYWMILDKDGKLVGDSKMRPEGGGPESGDNIGCPASEKEVAYFISLLRKACRLGDQQAVAISQRFRQNDVSHN